MSRQRRRCSQDQEQGVLWLLLGCLSLVNQVSCGNAVPRSRGLEAVGIRMDTSLAAEAEATSLNATSVAARR